jgi:hypothetical protein
LFEESVGKFIFPDIYNLDDDNDKDFNSPAFNCWNKIPTTLMGFVSKCPFVFLMDFSKAFVNILENKEVLNKDYLKVLELG